MDLKLADEQRCPLLAHQHPDDEERLMPKADVRQDGPLQPSRSQNIRRAIACTAKGLVLVGVFVYLFAGVGRNFLAESFVGTPAEADFDAAHHHGFELLPYPHDFDDPRVICEVVNVTDSASLLKTLSYNLTTEADKIKIFARGPIAGNVTFESGGTAGDDIEVDLKFSSPSEDESINIHGGSFFAARRHPPPSPLRVKVCPFYAPGGGYKAVGIFVTHHCDHKHATQDEPHGLPPPPPPPRRPHPPSGHPPPGPAVEASIAIRFPKPSSSLDRLEIHDFSTELAGFKHTIPSLDIAFTKLTIVGGVEAASIGATELAVVSVLGGIHGNFSASKELLLTSSNSPIDANVELWNTESEEGLIEPTKLTAVADKSYIRANVSLLTYSSENIKPTYIVKTVASNDYATVNFTSQPLGSALSVETFSKDHPTSLYLDPAFEGSFAVSSVFHDPIIVAPEDTKDPYGEGRKRVVKVDKTWTPWTKKGSIEWVKEADDAREGESRDIPLGNVKVTTVKAPAAMILG